MYVHSFVGENLRENIQHVMIFLHTSCFYMYSIGFSVQIYCACDTRTYEQAIYCSRNTL